MILLFASLHLASAAKLLEGLTCPPDAFACAEGRCIPNEWVCDGFVDCVETGRGLDEAEWLCSGRQALAQDSDDLFSLPEQDGLFAMLSDPTKRVQIRPLGIRPSSTTTTTTTRPTTTTRAPKSVCPSEMLLHSICSKTLDAALESLGEEEATFDERRDPPFPSELHAPSKLKPGGPMTVEAMIRGCLSYATYKGCVVALAPDLDCLPSHRISAWLTSTYRLFCNAHTLANVTQHFACFHKVRSEPTVFACEARYLRNRALFPGRDYEICPSLLDFFRFSQCVQESVKRKCDRAASSFFEEVQQNMMKELSVARCHLSAINFPTSTTTPEPKTKGLSVAKQLDELSTQALTDALVLEIIVGHLDDPEVEDTDVLPFMMGKEELETKLRPLLERLPVVREEAEERRIRGGPSRKDKRLFPPCSRDQEARGRQCFRWVSALPHSGTNLPPNEWLLQMAAQTSPLIDDTCHALKIYQRCLEETVYRSDGRCAFESWVPIHVEIAQGVLCDPEVLEIARRNSACLTAANSTLGMGTCAAMDLDIVRHLRAVYQEPQVDSTCQVLSTLKATYECIGDAAFAECGRELLFGLGKVKMNVLRLAIEEGCSGC